MATIRVFLPLLVTVCAYASTAVAQSGGIASVLPSDRVLERFGLERAWWGQATIDPSRSTVRHLTLDEDGVCIQTTGGIATAFDSETGGRLWAHQLGRRDQTSYPAVSNDDIILIVVGITLYAIDKFGGDVLWEVRLPRQPSTSPAIDERYVYIGALDGSIFAFDLRKIRELYQENLLPQWSEHSLKWRFKTGKEISTPAVSIPPMVNFASRDGSLYSVEIESRKLRWQFETDEPIAAPLASAQDSLILASEDFNVYCISATRSGTDVQSNGRVRWEFISGFPVYKAPCIVGNHVYLTPERGGMFCLSVDRGFQRWWRPNVVEFLAASRSHIYASDRLGNVLILSREDGAVVGALPLRRFSVRVHNDRTDRLYLATPDGFVLCLREKGTEFPLFHKYPERMPILPEFAPETEPAADDAAPAEGAGEANDADPAAPAATDAAATDAAVQN